MIVVGRPVFDANDGGFASGALFVCNEHVVIVLNTLIHIRLTFLSPSANHFFLSWRLKVLSLLVHVFRNRDSSLFDFLTKAVQRRFISFYRLQTLFLHCNWRYNATVVSYGPLLLRPNLALQIVWVKTAQTFSKSWQVIGPVDELCLLVILDLIVLGVLGQLF